jgi:hypothetical protein
MLGFNRKTIAVGAALALLGFGSMAQARDCVWQSEVDTAYDQLQSAIAATGEANSNIDYFPYSMQYMDLENAYYSAVNGCHTIPWYGHQVDMREVLDCEEGALSDFEMAKSNALMELGWTLSNAEYAESLALGAYNALAARPRCDVE